MSGDPDALLELALPALSYAAPVLVMASLALLLAALSPRLAALAWLPLVLSVVVMLFAEVFQLPQWVQDLSPFEHLALVPAESFRWAPFLVLLRSPPPSVPRDRSRSLVATSAESGACSVRMTACGSPSRGGSSSPEAPAPPRWASGARSSTTARWSVKRLAAPGRARPAGAQRPAGTSPTGDGRPTWSRPAW